MNDFLLKGFVLGLSIAAPVDSDAAGLPYNRAPQTH